MNGQPRINPGFLVGHHEVHESARRWEKYDPAKIASRKLVRPKRKAKADRRRRA